LDDHNFFLMIWSQQVVSYAKKVSRAKKSEFASNDLKAWI